MNRFPIVLCILDGWGLRGERAGNAVRLAKTPNFDRVMSEFPSTELFAHGQDVGLPDGQIGNSEVGHLNIGAGRIVEMELSRINRICSSGELGRQAGFERFVAALRKSGGTAHVLGVLSDGGVHAHLDHMVAAVGILSESRIPTAIHLMTDGRDVVPMSAMGYLDRMSASLSELPGPPRIATVSGRYFAMDRDRRWDRTQSAYNAMVNGDAPRLDSARSVIADAYANEITDEFIRPAVIGDYQGMHDSDGLLCLNFRADRMRQILSSIGEQGFDHFDTGTRPQLSAMSGFVSYSDIHDRFMDRIFDKDLLSGTLGQQVSEAGYRQLRVAESEKYPHVTYFLNGGEETPFPGEDRRLIPSPKVPTYDLQPEMSERGVTATVVDALKAGDHQFIIVNYANPDMVGHTGDLDAAVKACEAVDQGVGEVIEALRDVGGVMILTADHGNCEVMIDPESQGPHTAHTTNPVPFAVIGSDRDFSLRSGGRLADVAPTLLALAGLQPAKEMTGVSLIDKE